MSFLLAVVIYRVVGQPMTEGMPMNAISYTPIGVIRSPFTEPAGMPIQSVAAKGVAGIIELVPTYQDGLQDLEGFSYL